MGLVVRLAPAAVWPSEDDGRRWFRLDLQNRSAKVARAFSLRLSNIRPRRAGFVPIGLMSAVNIEPHELNPGNSWVFDLCHSEYREGAWCLCVAGLRLPPGSYVIDVDVVESGMARGRGELRLRLEPPAPLTVNVKGWRALQPK